MATAVLSSSDCPALVPPESPTPKRMGASLHPALPPEPPKEPRRSLGDTPLSLVICLAIIHWTG